MSTRRSGGFGFVSDEFGGSADGGTATYTDEDGGCCGDEGDDTISRHELHERSAAFLARIAQKEREAEARVRELETRYALLNAGGGDVAGAVVDAACACAAAPCDALMHVRACVRTCSDPSAAPVGRTSVF